MWNWLGLAILPFVVFARNSAVTVKPANKQCEHEWTHICWLATGQEVAWCHCCGSIQCGDERCSG